MLQLSAELEIDASLEDGRVVCSFLQGLQEAVELSSDLVLLSLKVLLHLGLDIDDRLLDLTPTDLPLLVLRLHRDTSQQFLHEADEDIIIGLLILEVLESGKQKIVFASLEFDLVEHLDEDGVDAAADGLEGIAYE